MQTDFLNSYLRHEVLSTLPEREVNLALLTGDVSQIAEKSPWILTDSNNHLGEWQETDALHHWQRTCPSQIISQSNLYLVMREILPNVVWETY